jgi:predicted phage terminase large subunit-like protein
MDKSQEKKSRSCPTCQKSSPEVTFYRTVAECRMCIRSKVAIEPKDTLDTRLAHHREKKLLKLELKKVARKRLDDRNRMREKLRRRREIQRILPVDAPQVEVDGATKEMALRVLQRRRLIEFTKAFHPKYLAGWVHADICRRLEKFCEDVAAGKSPRLMILMPPRHGKSKLASVMFPAWALGHHPDFEVIACAYAISLPLDFSSEVRGIIRTDRYKTLFPGTALDDSRQSIEAWKLKNASGVGAGGYVAAGVGGPINGKGAHILVIDDPVKNAEEAGNPDHLRKIMEWYDSTAYTRLAPGGGVLVIMTWWSDLDPAGTLQERMKEDPEADQFEVIKYPAIAVEDEEFRVKGEALHPERFDVSALERIKRTQGGDKGRFWNALYQQNPVPGEGAMFTKDMFVWRNEDPNLDGMFIYQAWDYAIGEKRVNDWTVGMTIAVDCDDNAHLIDVRRFRSSDQAKIADEMLDMWERYTDVMALGAEDGQIWRGVKSHFTKRCLERGVYPVLEELKPLTDKLVRATPLQGRMQQRKVTFPKSGSWVHDVYRELLRFPHGMHADCVDALAWCIRISLNRSAPRKPVVRNLTGKEETVEAKVRRLGGSVSGRSHMEA